MTQTILAALLPIVFVVSLGLLAARLGIVEKAAAPEFAEFIVRFALPIALFGGVLKISPAQIENGPYIVAMTVGLMIPYAIAFVIGRFVLRHDLGESALQGLTSAFPSMAYSGLPVLEAVVGPSGVLAVVVGNLVTSLIMIPLTLVLVQIGQGGKAQGSKAQGSITALVGRSLVGSVKQPVVWLPIAGAVLALSGVHVPQVLDLSFDLIGKSAAGVALFTLGLMLYGQRLHVDLDIALNALLKNIGQPAAMLGLTLLLGIHGPLAKELFLTGAIPTATAASMLALRYRTYADEAAASTLVSTVGSVVTITLAIVIAEHLA
jgi:malonate transporter and related proteins